MNELDLFIQNREVKTSSRKVAEAYNKRHADVLKKIEGYIKDYPQLAERYFSLGSYLDENNQERPEYIMNRKGFSILVNKFTGKKALGFTIKYTDLFEKMAWAKMLEKEYGKIAKENQKTSTGGRHPQPNLAEGGYLTNQQVAQEVGFGGKEKYRQAKYI